MKVLIITRYFAPYQAVASIRWTKIAKYLKINHDVEIDVLVDDVQYEDTSNAFAKIKKDSLLEKDLQYVNSLEYIKFGKAYCLSKDLFNKIKKSKSEVNEVGTKSEEVDTNPKVSLKTFLISDLLANFLISSGFYKNIKNKSFEYDAIISSFGPAWVHMVAKKVKKKTNIFWIADFRDPCANDLRDGKWALKYHKNFVNKYCSKADIFFKVNEELPIYQSKGIEEKVVYNGYDLAEKNQKEKPNKFNFVYTGVIYPTTRDFSEVFHSVKELIDENIISSDDVEFHYAGNTPEHFIEQAKKYVVENLVKNHGIIARAEAMDLQREAAILLMANPNTKEQPCEWSGKIYEYMMSEKPIVYLVTGDVPYSLVYKNINKIGGVCYEQCRHSETYPELKNYIKEKYLEWKKTGDVSIECDKEYVGQFSYSNIAGIVYDVIKKGNTDK